MLVKHDATLTRVPIATIVQLESEFHVIDAMPTLHDPDIVHEAGLEIV